MKILNKKNSQRDEWDVEGGRHYDIEVSPRTTVFLGIIGTILAVLLGWVVKLFVIALQNCGSDAPGTDRHKEKHPDEYDWSGNHYTSSLYED